MSKRKASLRSAQPARIEDLAQRARAEQQRLVVRAACELLREDGPNALNVRELASKVSASTTIIYTLFGGREGLLDALWRDGLDRLADAFEKVENRDSLIGLAGLARAYRSFAINNREFYIAVAATPRSSVPVRDTRPFQILLQAVRGCMNRGLLPKAPADAVADAFWGLVHGMVSLELGGHFSSGKVAEARIIAAGSAMLSGFRR